MISEINTNAVLLPDFICYDRRLCDFLSSTFSYKSHGCRKVDQMGLKSNTEYLTWKSIIDAIKPSFYGCHTRFNDPVDYSQYSSLYQCQNTSKYISKHRIVDGINDCYLKDDEQDYELSCLLNDSFRFKCANETQCKSPISKSDDCPSTESAYQNIDTILFHQICDRYVDILPQLINGQNHTDETNCENWPCNNIYTRCDGFWNFPNGEDEENCHISNCSRQFLDCISPFNYTKICLPSHQIQNGIVDCLGGLDELQLCRIASYYFGITYQFRCLNNTICVEPLTICNLNDNYSLDIQDMYGQNICHEWIYNNMTGLKNYICHINTFRRVAFTLKQSKTYPRMNTEMTDPVTNSEALEPSTRKYTMLTFGKLHLPSYWKRCRSVYGLLKNENSSLACFCPPNYYGNFCQYQNQRVSLTLTLLSMSRSAIYSIFIKLIDDDNNQQEINSYEQIMYVPKSECGQPFNVYLLYSTRPKRLSKNYSIHIDVYDKSSLKYIASWYFKLEFAFLPVNRLAVLLKLRYTELNLRPNDCPLKCKQGTCLKYINDKKFFCQCNPGWSGMFCHIPLYSNNCSSDSIWLGNIYNRSICMCPLEKFGPHCLLKHSCPENYCENNG
ncbi:unnamed protein product, partial [Adineta ricciae]